MTRTLPRPMAGNGNTVQVSFEDASRIIAEHASPAGIERIKLADADGRVLAKNVIAQCMSPSTLVSAMDGYAVRDSDLQIMPASLRIAGQSFAGSGFSGPLPARACVRIFTGAPAPLGTDRVIMQEDVQQEEGRASFRYPLPVSRHLRLAGSDFRKGDTIIPAGCVLTPQRLIGVAASNLDEIDVVRKPRVAILCCGDELVEPGLTPLPPDTIPESISYGVAALIRHWGGTVVARWRKPDDLASLRNAASEAAAIADLIVIVGGASVGDKDFAKDAFAGQGLDFLFKKVAIKPGKPVWFGNLANVLVIGLPGNPTSAMVTARLFLAPALAGLTGRDCAEALEWADMVSNQSMEACGERDTFLRANVVANRATLITDQASACQKALTWATHLIWRPRGAPTSLPGSPIKALVL